MKKILLFVVVSVMLFSSAALADPNPASFLYGTWERIVEYDSKDLNIDIFHVYPDHRAYCFSAWVSGLDVDTSLNGFISWSFEDGKFYLFYDSGFIETFVPQDEYTLKTDEKMPVLYKKIYPRRDL